MSESQSGFAVLDDVDKQTFLRFCQYVYTGDYAAADPDILLDSLMVGGLDSAERESGWSSKKKKWLESPLPPESHKSILWSEFKELSYPTPTPQIQPAPNREPLEDCTPVLLSHAYVHVFADKYDILPLRTLALYKLHRTLIKFALYKEQAGDIAELVGYSYANTPEPNLGGTAGSVDALRELVMNYIACEAENLVESERFLLLLEEGGTLAKDIMRAVVKRIG
ncbi:MAG: hypothetical protein M1839_008345 [Geoglossum umbratile]|nr:MAG: hypothetical protein M1839_008345 [Geoglossum umbratile]